MIVNPLVSTIVLCYNQSRFVSETLDSVKAQTYERTQSIVVDDCSSDDSVAIIEGWLQHNGVECRFIRHKTNQGICKSLNDGLAVASGKYISMTASDDVWLPEKLAQQVEIMESQPDHVGVLYSDAFQMDQDGHLLPGMFMSGYGKLPQIPQGQVLDTLVKGNFIPAMTTLVRRSCYEKLGCFDESLPWEDWDMWLRIARQYSFVYSQSPSAKYRVHSQSYSHSDSARMYKGSFAICVKQLRLGALNEVQRTVLLATAWNYVMELYKRKDPSAAQALLQLWQISGNKRAAWLYPFARFGVPLRHLQRADAYRKILRNLFARRPVKREQSNISVHSI
ncbi:MAG: glycosyltransferase [Candidatus Sulfotelmatobacter sp.]